MRGVCTLIFCVAVLLAAAPRGMAQKPDSGRRMDAAYVDSLMSDDSLMKDLNSFIDSVSRPKTLLAIEMGAGNGFFTTKSATAATGYTTKTFLNPSVTYLHKSGFGISASAYATTDLGKTVIYQGAITPSFDIGKRYWAAGITYTRYINKDSVSFGVNPLRNDAYVYSVFKRFWLEPGLAMDFSFDSYKLEKVYIGDLGYPGPPISTTTANIRAHTIGGIFSLQHDFEWFGLVQRNDHVAFTPMLITLADASNYDISVPRNIKTTGAIREAAQNIAKSKGGSQSTGWAFESIGALFNAIYTYKHLLLSPQVLATYFLNASPGVAPLRVSYLFNIGVVF